MIDILLTVVAIVVALVCLIFTIHTAIVFQRFNDGIKAWASALDSSAMDAINRSARNILRELDSKITDVNSFTNVNSDDVQSNKNENDEN